MDECKNCEKYPAHVGKCTSMYKFMNCAFCARRKNCSARDLVPAEKQLWETCDSFEADIEKATGRLMELSDAEWTNINDYYRPALVAILDFLIDGKRIDMKTEAKHECYGLGYECCESCDDLCPYR